MKTSGSWIGITKAGVSPSNRESGDGGSDFLTSKSFNSSKSSSSESLETGKKMDEFLTGAEHSPAGSRWESSRIRLGVRSSTPETVLASRSSSETKQISNTEKDKLAEKQSSDKEKVEYTPEQLKKMEKKRIEVMKELLYTEKQYVKDMDTIITVFLKPIREKNLLSKTEVSSLFANIEALIPVNALILGDLERVSKNATQKPSSDTKETPNGVGEIFLERGDLLKLYAVYCSNQPNISKRLVLYRNQYKQFDQFVKKCMSNERCRCLDMESFLIMPLQRMCKYPLLLKEILKHTPENTEEFAVLTKCLEKIKVIVDAVNERVRKVENVNKLMDVSEKIINATKYDIVDHKRRLLSDGTFRLDGQEKKYFLFNDKLLICDVIKQPLLMPSATPAGPAPSPGSSSPPVPASSGTAPPSAPSASPADRFYKGKLFIDSIDLVFSDETGNVGALIGAVEAKTKDNAGGTPGGGAGAVGGSVAQSGAANSSPAANSPAISPTNSGSSSTLSSSPAHLPAACFCLGGVKAERIYLVNCGSPEQKTKIFSELKENVNNLHDMDQSIKFLIDNREKFAIKRKKESQRKKKEKERQDKKKKEKDVADKSKAKQTAPDDRLIRLTKQLAEEKQQRRKISDWAKNLELVSADLSNQVRTLKAKNKELEAKSNKRGSQLVTTPVASGNAPTNTVSSNNDRLLKEFEQKSFQLAKMVDDLTKENIKLRNMLAQAKNKDDSDSDSDLSGSDSNDSQTKESHESGSGSDSENESSSSSHSESESD